MRCSRTYLMMSAFLVAPMGGNTRIFRGTFFSFGAGGGGIGADAAALSVWVALDSVFSFL